jgi:hypothetical protein
MVYRKSFKGPLQCFLFQAADVKGRQKFKVNAVIQDLSQASLCQDSRYNAESKIHRGLTLSFAIQLQSLARRSCIGLNLHLQTRTFGLSKHGFWNFAGEDRHVVQIRRKREIN